MGNTSTLERDYFDIVEQKDTLIGRDLTVQDGSIVYRGPITAVRTTSSHQIIISLGWRAVMRTSGGTESWHLLENQLYFYGFELNRATVRIDQDGAINITERLGLIGKIMPTDAASLEKPTS